MPSRESKNTFASIREKILALEGKQYWRSLEEHADTPEFRKLIAEEYPHEIEDWDDGLSRRNFVKVMGASLALAGLSGCVIQPPEKIVPYVKSPNGMLPGKANFFATGMTLGGITTGLLVKAYEGRPVKIEGNPDHPGSLGATNIIAQASLLTMYDPDRSQEFTYRGGPKTWELFMPALRSAVEENRVDGGAGVRFLTETVVSPTLIDQFTRLKTELPNAKWVQYEPVNSDNAMTGARMAFGSPVNPIYKFDKADRVLSLDADIFSDFNVGYIKGYAAARRYSEEKKQINRLYCVESSVSITGAKADHRLAVKPSQVLEIAKAIAKAVGVAGANSTYTENAAWIAGVAKDLTENRGRSIVVAGENQPPVVHALVHAMNGALGNAGQTVLYSDPLSANSERPQIEQLRELITDIDGGRVKMLVVLGGNPVYDTPADLKLSGERLRRIPLCVHLGLYADETAEYCHWHVPEKHYLEGWSDGRAYDGTASIMQPIIEPLYDGKNVHEVVQLFFKENFDKKDHDIVKEFWQRQNVNTTPPAAAKPEQPAQTQSANTNTVSSPAANAAATANANTTAANTVAKPAANSAAPAAAASRNFDDTWRKIVHDGVVPNTSAPAKAVTANAAFLTQPENKLVASGSLEINIRRDPAIHDGRFANNGWLQELPKSLNKTTWDNVGLVSPRTAARLGLNVGTDSGEYVGGEQGTAFINTRGGNQFSDLVKLKYLGGEIEKGVPVWISPGQPDDVITIFLGYGRTRAGQVGNGIGYNAYDVRRSDAMYNGFGEIQKTGEQATIASTQIHFNMEGRDLLRVWDLDEFEKNPAMGHQHNEYPLTMYPIEQHQEVYEKHHRWGMTIDLNSCVGCSACVLACQSENNIPVVGKEQVNRSREMHWLRVDAYYSGDDINNVEGPHFQPVLCQQCEQAPCEVVCPVHATVHSAEGLNDMVYNRCVGTRYCSNNCPYKVRRFNFLLYQDWNTPQYKLMRNPEVSIRSRGVMEKCTYCTQRIAAARIEAEKDRRAIRDGEIVTACQAVCPTDAIIFGDLHDEQSAVYKTKRDHRNYVLLNELNTQPRTTYLAGLKNQNKEMPDYRPHVAAKQEEPESGTENKGGERH